MSTLPPLPLQPITQPQSVSPSLTQSWLKTYLGSSSTQPVLHPDASLTPSGPSANQGVNSVVLHNLRRLVGGLGGEYALAAMGDEDGDGDKAFRAAAVVVDGDGGEGEGNRGGKGNGDEGEWQDKIDFERAQSEDFGEVGDRDGSAGKMMVVGSGMGIGKRDKKPERIDKAKQKEGKVDKAARKAAKKQRKKALRANGLHKVDGEEGSGGEHD